MRREADFYATPRWAVEEALSLVDEDFIVEEAQPRHILDVGAGEGIWGEVARELWPNSEIVGVELRDVPPHPAYTCWVSGCFFARWERLFASGPYDLIMGNPPFGEVERIIDGCWKLLTPPIDARKEIGGYWGGGRLAFFLRLAFLEGQKRRDGLYKEHPLKRLGTYSRRVSFQADGKTNATAHGLFLWQLGCPGSTALRFF